MTEETIKKLCYTKAEIDAMIAEAVEEADVVVRTVPDADSIAPCVLAAALRITDMIIRISHDVADPLEAHVSVLLVPIVLVCTRWAGHAGRPPDHHTARRGGSDDQQSGSLRPQGGRRSHLSGWLPRWGEVYNEAHGKIYPVD